MLPSLRSGLAAPMYAILATVLAPVAAAQSAMPDRPAAACVAPAPLPAELAAWPDRTALPAAAESAGLPAAALAVGKAFDAALLPTPEVHYVLRPEKPGGSVSFGGLYALNVKDAGNYRIALGSAAWVDLVQDGKPIVSAAHGHGPECTGVRKMVDFALAPGRYVLQVSANASAAMPLLVVRLP